MHINLNSFLSTSKRKQSATSIYLIADCIFIKSPDHPDSPASGPYSIFDSGFELFSLLNHLSHF